MAIAHAVVLALGLAAAQSTEQALPVPATLDVIVRDARGRDVETLTAADFVVTENGTPVPVSRSRFVKIGGGDGGAARRVTSAGASAEQRAGGDARLFGIYLDEFHVTPGARADEARETLARWVLEALGPDDLVIVLRPLDSLLSIDISDNREAAARVIRSFAPRRGDYSPRTAFERDFIAGAPANVDTARAQITASSLHALVTRMSRIASQRKTLLVFSEGLDRAGVRRRDGELPGLDSVAVAANRVHVSVYPIDTSDGSLPADASADVTRSRERLDVLARETGGEVIGRRGPVVDGLARALRDASGYYSLSLSPASERPDGRLHAVEVSLRRTAPGTTLRPRKGYWSPSEAEIRPAAPLPSVLPVPSTRLVARRTSPLIRPWFGLSKGADGSRRVDFVWEPVPRTPGDRTVRPVPARIALSVTSADGTPLFSGVVSPTSPALAPAPGTPSRVSFVSPAGRLLVEMAIEDASSRVIDHDVRDLAVNPLDGPVNMGTVEVLRARTAREQAALLADPYAAPVADRSFRRTERLILRLPVFAQRGVPQVTVRLLSDIGGPMRALEATLLPGREGVYQVDVPLSPYASGAYAVEFQARTTEGSVSERLPFRIVP
jgi:VWFA-related protein